MAVIVYLLNLKKIIVNCNDLNLKLQVYSRILYYRLVELSTETEFFL